jgi:eukaryotic-like serine/threonine-protein kinase
MAPTSATPSTSGSTGRCGDERRRTIIASSVRHLSHYEVFEEIGRGGMGVVYRAVDTRLGRPVAIKMLPSDATADPDRIRRFVQEARAASALNHPNIVTIYDIDEDASTTFIAMELVDGAPLDRLLREGRLTPAQAIDYAAQAASALEAAHARGIIHRDIKPANIMIMPDGRAKVLDFGLAKLVDRGPAESTMSALGTRPGLIMGTAAYMSPEQAEGRPLDARSDIFSLGAVLYEMLAGRRPFAGDSDIAVITSILRDTPPPIRSVRPDVPVPLQAVVDRCLAKSPADRFQNVGALRAGLAPLGEPLVHPESTRNRSALLAVVALLLVAAAGFAVWQWTQIRRERWVQNEALPEIERLQNQDMPLQAVALAREVERYAPTDAARVRDRWYLFNMITTPDGADVSIKRYLDADGAWTSLGRSPIENLRLPFGYYRVRIARDGYQPMEFAVPMMGRKGISLIRESDAVPGMVFVPGGAFTLGVAGTVALPNYWIDRLEVTNAEFKKFVDDGGYRKPEYWKQPFVDGIRTIAFDEAMARFRDSTGRPGPATWELGSFPEGRGDFPVGGISWFEAAAFAAYVGKSLPTVHQWFRAAPPEEVSSDIIEVSNFESRGPVRAGERPGLGPFGTLDMAGNVKEWSLNAARSSTLRYILGGAWDEPSYRYSEEDAQDPWDRNPRHGIRLVKNLGPVEEGSGKIDRVYGDPKSVIPVPDAQVEVYTRFYAYDRTPLNAKLEARDDTSPYWTKEKISFDAAYAGERIPAYLFLPKNASPPYQTVVLFPSAYATNVPTSESLDVGRFDFIVRSGRALLYPIYQGTYERRREITTMSQRRDLHVQWAKDFFRAVDYLETRPEIDKEKLAYYSLSMGAFFGPIPVALDTRVKAAVFASGGLRFNYPPEIQPANFAPRIKVPVLQINGKHDFQAPLEAQERMWELLGTPPEHKHHVALEGGHVPTNQQAMIKEVLAFFDRYLGEIK